MGDKTTWQSQTRVYIEHCHWLLALRLSVTAAHWPGSCSCRVILFGVRKLLPRSRRYLMLLKPDRVDTLETVKWIALCLKCGQQWTMALFAFDSVSVTVSSVRYPLVHDIVDCQPSMVQASIFLWQTLVWCCLGFSRSTVATMPQP